MELGRVRKYDKYYSEYTPNWIEHLEDKREEQISEVDEWIESKEKVRKKNALKKKSTPKKKSIKKHKGKQSKKKFYAINKGKKNNTIVESWVECSKLVIGYKGAIYKGFNTKDDAEAFIESKR